MEKRYLRFSALSPSFSEQLEGVLLHKELVRYDTFALAIVQPKVNGLLSDSEVEKSRKRLIKKIEQDVKMKNLETKFKIGNMARLKSEVVNG